MTLNDRENELHNYILEHISYQMCRTERFNFAVMKKINNVRKKAGGHTYYANECVIMADTETSKDPDHRKDIYENHIVAWTISIRAAGLNIVTLYGTDPEEMIRTITQIHDSMRGDRTYIFFHNLAYDWVFLRQFCFSVWNLPVRQLNTKSHYPISIEWDNGIIFRDSLILAQRSLDKWSQDLDIEHKKAVHAWDYDKIRNQDGSFTKSELTYIEHDTLAGVECLDAMRHTLNKRVCTLPYTATGIVREAFRKTAKKNHGRDWFLRQYLNYEYVHLSEDVYHGGFVHQNRFFKNTVIDADFTGGEPVRCYDITSSYPWALISEKYPAGRFVPYPDCNPDVILKASRNYAFMMEVEFYDIRLRDPKGPMPYLQYSKCSQTINDLTDNGRIVKCDFCRIAICEIDLILIAQQYTWNRDYTKCTNVIVTNKDFLPRWFTDFVYQLFVDKTQYKGGDTVLYALSKAKLNSCYGMCCQHVMQNDITEDYDTGEYSTIIVQTEDAYQKYLDNKNTFLPYQIGIWCTAYACKNLFEIGECIDPHGAWLYSDTDSCFGYGWDTEKLTDYNDRRKRILTDRGYQGVEHAGKTYYPGIVELDKVCSEFVGIHSKCYAYRDAKTDELKITVAGVPKKGAACLNNDIRNFKSGFVFDGKTSGKLTHTYIYNKMHRDKHGNKVADSIDLSPCDYLVNDINTVTWVDLLEEEIEIGRNYEE